MGGHLGPGRVEGVLTPSLGPKVATQNGPEPSAWCSLPKYCIPVTSRQGMLNPEAQDPEPFRQGHWSLQSF